MDRKIELAEKREIQLQMLDEVDAFCRKNNIRYSLACGTLLGAVRHKGFIPWDDDMDIMMPVADLEMFAHDFSSENIQYIDLNNWKSYTFSFSKITHTKTYQKFGVTLKGWGIDIDVYPVRDLFGTRAEIDAYFMEAVKILERRLFIMKWRARIARRLPINEVPFHQYYQRKYYDWLAQTPLKFSGKEKHYLVHSGRPDWEHTYDFDLFETTKDILFEGHIYRSVEKVDEYLTQRYGNYMQLPPVEERVPGHGQVFYWK